MKTDFFPRLLAVASGSCLLIQNLFSATSVFTYQGRLGDGGVPASGTYDLRFTLFDAASGGTQIGETIVVEKLPVTLGQLQVDLDFGTNVFLGDERWLEIAVHPAASAGDYTILNPRQRIGVVPYALFALEGNPGPVGPVGPQGQRGEIGPAGISILWLGSLPSAPGNPGFNQAYHNTGDGVSYLFDGLAWQILAQDGATGAQGPQGENGATGPAGPQGPVGEVGPTGATGAQGPTGPPGAQGPLGPPGPMGPIGPEGPPGSLDAWSLTGSVGTDPLLNFLGTADETPLEIRVNNHLAVRIMDNPLGPFVGVNTNSPRATLHVNGSALIEGNLSVSGIFKLPTSSIPRLAINTETPKPDYELSVDGQIVCEELLVQDSADWPDYVFAEGYLLRSLEEVDAYIKSQRRLPGIPSAADVAKEGIPLGVMQKRLMEKIEELTLYSIAQNKRLAEQELELRALAARLKQMENR